jgi:hypothetical protein
VLTTSYYLKPRTRTNGRTLRAFVIARAICSFDFNSIIVHASTLFMIVSTID